MSGPSNQLLEPSLSVGEGRELLVQNLLTARSVKPNIGPVEKSSTLKQVTCQQTKVESGNDGLFLGEELFASNG